MGGMSKLFECRRRLVWHGPPSCSEVSLNFRLVRMSCTFSLCDQLFVLLRVPEPSHKLLLLRGSFLEASVSLRLSTGIVDAILSLDVDLKLSHAVHHILPKVGRLIQRQVIFGPCLLYTSPSPRD